MARLLIDTGPVVHQLRGHQPTIRLLRQVRGGERLAISAITRLEIYAGMYEDERYSTRKLLARFLTYSVSPDIADLAGELIARSRARAPSFPYLML